MSLFTKAFWVNTLEVVVVAFATTFAGALVITTTPDWKTTLAALVAGGIAAIYAFAKQVGAVQAMKAANASKQVPK